MKRSLIIGGTRGLGKCLAIESNIRNIYPTIIGRSPRSDWDPTGEITSTFIRADVVEMFMTHLKLSTLDDGIQLTNIDYILCCVGIGYRGSFVEQSVHEVERLFFANVIGPFEVCKFMHRLATKPYHVITICSTSAYRVRQDELVYGATKAAQAQMARNMHQELIRDFPGSKSTIVFPGGMQTEFYDDTGIDTQHFMKPADVARIIWGQILTQPDAILEVHIDRDDHGNPVVAHGIRGAVYPK